MISVLSVGIKSAVLDMFLPVFFIPLHELGLKNSDSHSQSPVLWRSKLTLKPRCCS